MTGRRYPASAGKASGVDQIAGWIGEHPERLGVYAFIAARMIERDGLCYQTTFDTIVRAACAAGRTEAAARTQTFRGFAACAAGWVEPPAELEDD